MAIAHHYQPWVLAFSLLVSTSKQYTLRLQLPALVNKFTVDIGLSKNFSSFAIKFSAGKAYVHECQSCATSFSVLVRLRLASVVATFSSE